MKYLYLLLDLTTISVPLIFSIHPKIQFQKNWRHAGLAILLTAIIFLIFDSLFTSLGVWHFNSRYTTGIHLLNLPLEEILFFICIPYACLFTFFCLNHFYDLSWNTVAEKYFCILFSAILLTLGFIYIDKLYTSSTLISTALTCLLLMFFFNVNWLGKAFTVYLLLLIPFFVINGILTGTGLAEPVVQYNPEENLGIRILTIPIEDFFYGLELFLINLYFYFRFDREIHKNLR